MTEPPLSGLLVLSDAAVKKNLDDLAKKNPDVSTVTRRSLGEKQLDALYRNSLVLYIGQNSSWPAVFKVRGNCTAARAIVFND
jgi:hypothetical protein